MSMSVSFQKSTRRTNINHNNRTMREQDKLKNEHIDFSRSDENVYLIQKDLKQLYQEEFSEALGTGNTRKIANLFSDEFIKNGVETTIVDIKKGARIKCVDDFDAVGVCYPIHGFNAPYNVLEFAHDMPKTHDKPFIGR